MNWAELPDLDGYRISDTGIVQSRWKRRAGYRPQKDNAWSEMKIYVGKSGYQRVNMRVSQGKKRMMSVHSLVLLAFAGPRPPGCVIRHKDGNKLNNSLSNLAWGTSKENASDCVIHGTRHMGDNHYASRLTADDVSAIRLSELTDHDIASQYGITSDHAYKIRTGKRWNRAGNFPLRRRGLAMKLTDEQVEEIRQSPLTTVALAKLFGVSQPYVSHLRTGRTRPRR